MRTLVLDASGYSTSESKDPRTGAIIGAAIEVHRQLGPGLLESAYEGCLCHELHLRGMQFKRQLELPVSYKGLLLDCGYRIDLMVEDEIILELKAIEKLLPSTKLNFLPTCGCPIKGSDFSSISMFQPWSKESCAECFKTRGIRKARRTPAQ